MELPQLTVLKEQFAIRSVLGKLGPFESVYLAWDIQNEEQVVVREYLPTPLVTRGKLGLEVVPKTGGEKALFEYGYERTLKEAALLEKLDHPNVVRQLQFFEENGTIYRINEYHAGASLEYVIDQQGGKVGTRTAVAILMPLIEGLRTGHAYGLIHASISPQKIYLSRTGRPLLLSFNTTHLLLAQKLQQIKSFQRPGYSPPEQYSPRGKHGPWSDVYGCASTLYYMLTGDTLPDVPSRMQDDRIPSLITQSADLSPQIKTALQEALHLNINHRPQSIEQFRELLEGGVSADEMMPKTEPVSREAYRAASAPAREENAPQRSTKIRQQQRSPLPAASRQTATAPRASIRLEDLDFINPDGADTSITSVSQFAQDPIQDPYTPVPKGDGFGRAAEPVLLEYEATSSPSTDNSWKGAYSYTPGGRVTKRNGRQIALLSVVFISTIVLAYLAYSRWMKMGEQEYEVDLNAYQLVLARGDSLVKLASDITETGNAEKARSYLSDAREVYLLAMSIRANDPYVQDMIGQIDQMMQIVPLKELDEKERLALISKGDSLQRSADQLLIQGDSVQARAHYLEARTQYVIVLDVNPEDSLAGARFREANQRIVAPPAEAIPPPAPDPTPPAISQAARDRQMYIMFKSQGDSAFESQDYEQARRKFQEALSFKPNDEHASLRIRQIDQRLQEQQRLGLYRQHMNAGNKLLAAGRPAEARREFELALENMPDDADARAALSSLDTKIEEQTRRQEQYLSNRSRGDAFEENLDYEAALDSYKKALEALPGDQYVQNKIDEISEVLADQMQEEEVGLPEGMVDDDGIYNFFEEPPVLLGGLDVLQSRLRYPARALDARVEGRVTVRMIVDETGQMVDPEVIKGLGHGCDQEVLRVIRGARFEPGRVNGEPVKVWHTLYFEFKIEDQ